MLQNWKKRWRKYIISEGGYFLGNNRDIDKYINIIQRKNKDRIFSEHRFLCLAIYIYMYWRTSI